MSVGRSKITPFKQQDLQLLFKDLLYKTECVFNKHSKKDWLDKTFHLFDVTAGDAIDNLTSPIIFLDKLLLHEGLDFEATFIEKDKKSFSLLKKNLKKYISRIVFLDDKDYFRINVSLKYDKSENILPSLLSKSSAKYGLLYCDMNGYTQSLWNSIIEVTKKQKYLDVLINFSSVTLLRNMGVKKVKGFKKYNKNLSQLIDQICLYKNSVYIRDVIKEEPSTANKWKFIMLFCTNFDNYNLNKLKYKFVPVNSQKGQKIINLLMKKGEKNGH